MGFKNQRKQQASLTVFLSMTIIMIVSLILSLVEVVHFMILKSNVEAISQIGIESSFADYNRLLYEDYGILAVDTGYCKQGMDLEKMETRIRGYLQDNLSYEGTSFIKAGINEVKILEYGLLIDSYGAAVIKEAAKDTAYSIPQSLLTELNATGALVDADSFDNSQANELLNNSLKEIDENKDEPKSDNSLQSNLSKEDQRLLAENGNPIKSALEWKKKSVLAQIIDTSSISNKAIVGYDLPSKRNFYTGNSPVNLSVNSMEKVLYSQYLKTRFSSYRSRIHDKGINYEWEYVINGKDSDMANLEATVVKLLATREVANLTFLSGDVTKQAEAEAISVAICAGLALPVLVEPIKWGIIAAWAYLESVLDVRLLLNGGKVSPVKNSAEWTSNILMFPNYINTQIMARDSGSGMDYEDYLMIMTMLTSTKNLGLRSLDVFEDALRSSEDYREIRIENFLYSTKILFEYGAVPIFASVTPLLDGQLEGYNFDVVKELSYL